VWLLRSHADGDLHVSVGGTDTTLPPGISVVRINATTGVALAASNVVSTGPGYTLNAFLVPSPAGMLVVATASRPYNYGSQGATGQAMGDVTCGSQTATSANNTAPTLLITMRPDATDVASVHVLGAPGEDFSKTPYVGYGYGISSMVAVPGGFLSDGRILEYPPDGLTPAGNYQLELDSVTLSQTLPGPATQSSGQLGITYSSQNFLLGFDSVGHPLVHPTPTEGPTGITLTEPSEVEPYSDPLHEDQAAGARYSWTVVGQTILEHPATLEVLSSSGVWTTAGYDPQVAGTGAIHVGPANAGASVTIRQYDASRPDGGSGDPANPLTYGQALLGLAPDPHYNGALAFDLRARMDRSAITQPDVYSPVHHVSLTFAAVYSQTDAPLVVGTRGTALPHTTQGSAVAGRLFAADPDVLPYSPTATDAAESPKPIRWQISPVTDETNASYQPAFSSSVSTVTLTNTDSVTGAVTTIGTATLSAVSSTHATITLTPAGSYHGTLTAQVRVYDGGDPTAAPGPSNGFSGWSGITTLLVEQHKPPGAPYLTGGGHTMPRIAENAAGGSNSVLHSDDPDAADTDLTFRLAAELPNGQPDVANWVEAPTSTPLETDSGSWSLPGEDATGAHLNKIANIRFRPQPNHYGVSHVWVQATGNASVLDSDGRPVHDAHGQEMHVKSPAVRLSVTVTSVPGAPSQPIPTTMPTVERGGACSVVMRSFDTDDGGAYVMELSTSRSGFHSGSATVSRAGTFSLGGTTKKLIEHPEDGAGSTEIDATLTFDSDSSGNASTSAIWVRCRETRTGLTSPPTRVLVTIGRSAAVGQLVRVVPGTTASGGTPVQFANLGPVLLSGLSITQGMDNPDTLTATLSDAELRAHFGSLPASGVVTPEGVELHVTYDGQPLFAGRVTRVSTEPLSGQVGIEASGLGAYLDSATLDTDTTTNPTVDQLATVMGFIDAHQALPFGDVGLTTADTTGDPAANIGRQLDLTYGTTLAQVADQLLNAPSGAELWVTADRVVHAASVRGTDRRSSVVLDPDNCETPKMITIGHYTASIIQVEGKRPADGSAPPRATATSAAALAVIGRVTAPIIRAQRIADQASLQAIADHVRDRQQAGLSTFSLVHRSTAESPIDAAADYQVGDVITVMWPDAPLEVAGTNLVVSCRVISRTIAFDDADSRSISSTLTLETLAADGIVRPRRAADSTAFLGELSSIHRLLSGY